MKKTIILNSDQTIKRAVTVIQSLPEKEPDVLHEVVIRPHHVDYSDLQRGLYFDWVGTIGNDLGYTKDEAHDVLKGEFLVPIYMENESGRHDGYKSMVESIKLVAHGANYNTIMNQIIHMTSLTKASMKEMRKYMDRVALHAQSLGITLRFPGDGYYDELTKRFKR